MRKPNTTDSNARFIKSSFWAYFGIFIILSLNLLTTIILARLLDKENWGVLSTIIAVVSFLSSFSEMGINYYIVYISSKLENNVKQLRKKLFSPIKWKLILIFIFSLLLLIFSNDLANFFKIKDGARYFIAGTIFFFLFNISTALNSILVGLKKFREETVCSTINVVARLLFSSILVLFGLGIDGALIGYIFAIFLSTSIQILLLRNFISFKAKEEDSIVEIFSFSFFYGISSIAGTFTMWTDSLMLGLFIGTTVVGIYRLATSITGAFTSLISTISKVTFPYFTSDESSGKDTFNNLSKVMKYALFISIPAMVGLAILSDAIINIFFGKQYIEASIPLIILSYLILDGVVSGIVISYLGAKKLSAQIGFSALLAAAVNVILNLILIPILGMIGAAVASITSRAFGLIFMVKTSENVLKTSFKFEINIPFISSIFMAMLIILLRLFIDPSSSIFSLLFFVFIGMLSYVLFAQKLGFDSFAISYKILSVLLPEKVIKLFTPKFMK
ncbi:MAG: oligosaccharide flippase family protein [Candidatus Micrarchaeota archaeon]|nr:oligosaccharide flippase family protein [Candidatus Micrarchaeota archaeon]